MAAATKSKFSRRPEDPTPAEIEARKAEVHAMRQAKLDAELANRELQEQETDDDDDYRDPRQVEQWIPVPAIDDDPREPSVVRHRREFYTRFFPNWSRLIPQLEHDARGEAKDWREQTQQSNGPPSVPTWMITDTMQGRTPREIIDEELSCLFLFQSTGHDLATEPSFIALQRRVLARYLWGIRREGRKVPRTPNWGFKLANQLMQERDETEPLDLFDVAPETVARVTNGVKLPAKPKRQRKQRDVIPFRSKRR